MFRKKISFFYITLFILILCCDVLRAYIILWCINSFDQTFIAGYLLSYPLLDFIVSLAFLLLIADIIIIEFFAEKIKEKIKLFKILLYNYLPLLLIILVISVFYIIFLPWSSIEIPLVVLDYIIKYSIFLFIFSILVLILYYGLSPISYTFIFKESSISFRIVNSLKRFRILVLNFELFLKYVFIGFIIFLITDIILSIFLGNILSFLSFNFPLYPVYRMPSHPGLRNYILTNITRLSTLLADFISVIVFSRFLRKYVNSLWTEAYKMPNIG